MPYNNLSAVLTAAQITAINGAITTLKTNLPFLVNLTPDERGTLSKMGADGYSYVTKAMDYATNNASIIPPALSISEGRKDLDLANALRPIWQQLNQLVESLSDTEMVAGIEAKEFADRFYELTKMMAKTNTPGMDAIASDLGTFYEKASQAAPPANPPQ